MGCPPLLLQHIIRSVVQTGPMRSHGTYDLPAGSDDPPRGVVALLVYMELSPIVFAFGSHPYQPLEIGTVVDIDLNFGNLASHVLVCRTSLRKVAWCIKPFPHCFSDSIVAVKFSRAWVWEVYHKFV